MTDKKYPWQKYPEIWKTESAFMSYVRGGIRRGLWNRYPVKLEFIKNNREKIPNPNPNGRVKEVWGGTCYLTGEKLPLKDLEVDHKKGNLSLKSADDLQSFVEGLLYLEESDLAFVSKEAHRIKSYAERMGITFDEAVIKKDIINFGKKSSDEMEEVLRYMNVVEIPKTKKDKVALYEKLKFNKV